MRNKRVRPQVKSDSPSDPFASLLSLFASTPRKPPCASAGQCGNQPVCKRSHRDDVARRCITIHIGQAGIQSGNACWELAALEKDYEEVGAETTEGDGEEEDFGEEY